MAKPGAKSTGTNNSMGAPSGGAPVTQLHCLCKGCKGRPEVFGFCVEHYDHYKFGLINKKGDRVPDYDQKLDHYLSHKKAA